jgi:UDP-N-acetylmuramoylalanine--D-glutamate ligase
MSIAANQTEADHFIYCAEDPITSEKVTAALSEKNLHAQLHPFGFESGLAPNQAAWLAEDQLHIDINTTPSSTQPFSMSIYELALQGKHNLYNSMAAGIAGRILDIKQDDIRNAMTDFRALEHRLQSLGEVQKIEFINDSKATNVNSTWYALESIQKPLIWIAGGVDKGNDYTELVEMVSTKVKAIICLGLDNRKLHEAFARHVDLMVNCRSMPEAVRMAYHLGDAGDAVLLSPACASFDLFENYEDRGNRFKQAFLSL